MIDAVKVAVAALADADDQMEKARASESAARSHRDKCAQDVVDAFVKEWQALPVEIKNRVRHEINTTKNV